MTYIDMDGVLCDLIGGLRKAKLIDHTPKSYYDISVDWAKLDKSFWMNLKPFQPFVGSFTIITCVYSRDQQEGKSIWCKRFYPNTRVIYHGPGDRASYAHRNFLIDDCAENVAAWIKAGGEGIVFHQPWSF